MSTAHQDILALLAEDVQGGVTTRSARVKWVIVADQSLGPGLVANATACLGAAVGAALPGLLGGEVVDGSGQSHAGLPWCGCPILGADAEKVRALHDKAVTREGIFVAGMSKHAQASRSYEEYAETLGSTPAEELSYYAISLVGPRNKIDKLVGGLPLLR
ncbi:DUF2000 domain-containing protein [Amycolatopsis rhizosphaerae]|uniref:DUF2000 domain-containing protein n=1 Tax=Amycolatopsis rhizosphaerae TaxID=2053003 RepID=A0A558DMN8_9PSEU|nr:DUF2000 domain-containing protein [Amycolatopsis rhizosphaerae]TVT62282.1 DUF2000 domain-containing protein [Amycolatopsis rhizosphaerae]